MLVLSRMNYLTLIKDMFQPTLTSDQYISSHSCSCLFIRMVLSLVSNPRPVAHPCFVTCIASCDRDAGIEADLKIFEALPDLFVSCLSSSSLLTVFSAAELPASALNNMQSCCTTTRLQGRTVNMVLTQCLTMSLLNDPINKAEPNETPQQVMFASQTWK